MAHEIQKNQIAWKYEQPWHGLGEQVEDDATGEEMLVTAGLDWMVQRRALAMRGSNGKGLLTEPLAPYNAIVRADTNDVFQVATKRYNVVQNREIVDLFREYCEAGHATMDVVGALRGGAVVWALARLGKDSDATLKGGDKLRGNMLFVTSHDGSLRTIGKSTQERVVCANTMRAALADGRAEFSLRHTGKWNEANKAKAKEQLGIAVESVQRLNEQAAKLSRVTIDSNDWIVFMKKLWGEEEVFKPGTKTKELTLTAKAIQDATIKSPGSQLVSAKGTLWGALNGVTYWVDHQRGRTPDERLFNAWFGSGETIKVKAMEAAMELATVG